MRFKVGDKILANVGEWVTGTIVRIGDNGHAYRIELQDDDSTNVYSPVDSDTYVREYKELRFAVGDRVFANVGDWVPGVVINLWDEGKYPYRIELQDSKRTNVHGPADDDAYVKRCVPEETMNSFARSRKYFYASTEPGSDRD